MTNPIVERKTCVNCGRDHSAADIGPSGWCKRCRARLLQRSRLLARFIGLVFTLGVLVLIFTQTGGDSRFIVGYVILISATYFLVVRITQRVAFEVLRARGVSPPQSGS